MAQFEASNMAQFNGFIAKHKATVVDFYATWCGPCVRIGPYVHKKCQEHGVPLVKVNVDVAGDISGKYAIQAMPTFHVVDTQGNSIFKVTGGSEKNVDDAIVKAKNHN